VLAVLEFPAADVTDLPAGFEREIKTALAAIASSLRYKVDPEDVSFLKVVPGSALAFTVTSLPSAALAAQLSDRLGCCVAGLFATHGVSFVAAVGGVRPTRLVDVNNAWVLMAN
jgi:hypothetical protein